MTVNDYVKFLTEQLWIYLTDEDKSKRQRTPTINNHWFGLFPMTLKLFIAKKKR